MERYQTGYGSAATLERALPGSKEFKDEVCSAPLDYSTIPISDINFTDELLGEGSFAKVYKANSKNGTYALKMFKPGKHEKSIKCILENVKMQKDILQHPQFLKPVIIPKEGNWYIMEYGEGSTFEERLKSGIDTRAKLEILCEYAKLLEHLHSKNCVIGDCNTQNAIVDNRNTPRFTDYDTVSAQDKQNIKVTSLYTPMFANKEQDTDQPLTSKSDMESLAYITLHSFRISIVDRMYCLEAYYKDLPHPLHEPLKNLVSGDRSVSASDFAEAIKRC